AHTSKYPPPGNGLVSRATSWTNSPTQAATCPPVPTLTSSASAGSATLPRKLAWLSPAPTKTGSPCGRPGRAARAAASPPSRAPRRPHRGEQAAGQPRRRDRVVGPRGGRHVEDAAAGRERRVGHGRPARQQGGEVVGEEAGRPRRGQGAVLLHPEERH